MTRVVNTYGPNQSFQFASTNKRQTIAYCGSQVDSFILTTIYSNFILKTE